MSTINYLDGTSLSSTALTDEQVEIIFQIATAQMLALVMFTVDMTLTAGSKTATPVSMANIAPGLVLIGTGIPDDDPTTISTVSASTITMSAAATVSGVQSVVVAAQSAYDATHVSWQEDGQPAWTITEDVVGIRCSTVDSPYSRVRDIAKGDAALDMTPTSDVFTRVWQVGWIFYGPNSLAHASAVRSALIKISQFADLLGESNLYVHPSIAEPGRNKELFQGQYWQRADLSARFNEEVTETTSVGIVESVNVELFTEEGEIAQFTVNP